MEVLGSLKKLTTSLESAVRKLQIEGLEKDEELRRVRPSMNYSNLEWRQSLPGQHEKIWKDECALSYATPYSPGGLFVNLKTLTAFSLEFVERDWKRTGEKCVYLRQQWVWIPDEEEAEVKEPDVKRLAIGMAGGFQTETEKGHVKKVFSLCTGPKFLDDYPIERAPESLQKLAEFVIKKDDASRQHDVLAWEATNDLVESKYARNLIQVDNGVKIASDPKTWKCAESGMTENLWLNLSTGYIGSGRPNWDGTGGTGAALRHYEATGGLYPLAVKLGTITPDGKADVYSYSPDEDCMVIDPLLPQHLAHFGIRVGDMRKTEKTIAEMEVDLNVKYDWSRLSEEGKVLEKVTGPYCAGLLNLGNSCYCNSVFQGFFAAPEFAKSFKQLAARYTAPNQPQFDVLSQFIKLGQALEDPEHKVRPLSHKPFEGSDYVSPRMIKTLLGENHRDFSTGEQQDAADYVRHVLDRLHRAFLQSNVTDGDVTPLFDLELEERIEDLQTGQVRYHRSPSNMLQLNVPYQPPAQPPPKDAERDVVSFNACLSATLNVPEIVDDFLSNATGKKGQASRTIRVAKYPRILIIQLRRFVLSSTGWEGVKLECSIPAPLSIDLGHGYRAKGKQPNETLLPDAPPAAEFVPNAQVLEQLMGFGYSREGATRAAKAGNNNFEAAVNWAMDHSGDADFNTPLPSSSGGSGGSSSSTSAVFQPDENVLGTITSMGFSREGAIRAAKATNNDAEAAVMWALEHSGDADFNSPLPVETTSGTAGVQVDEESVGMLMSMGFEADAATYALRKCDNNMERASDFLLSRTPDELAAEMASRSSSSNSAGKAPETNSETLPDENVSTKYHLRAVISHVGKSTMSGHYVAHVNQSGPGQTPRWVFFNDEKAVLAQDPPLDLGYLLVYEQV